MKQLIRLTENDIRHMVTEAVQMLTEDNMHILYHFTTIQNLYNMIAGGEIRDMFNGDNDNNSIKTNKNSLYGVTNDEHYYGSGKYALSFTRHKNSVEGFGGTYNGDDEDNEYENITVRLTFNMDKMTHIHGMSVEPFEYYSPNHVNSDEYNPQHFKVDSDFPKYDKALSAKSNYAKMKPLNVRNKKLRDLGKQIELQIYNEYKDNPDKFNKMAEENGYADNVFSYLDDLQHRKINKIFMDNNYDNSDNTSAEYLQQAEEIINLDNREIPNALNCVERVDVLLIFDSYDCCQDIKYLYWMVNKKNNPNIMDKIYVYLDEKDFKLQTNRCIHIADIPRLKRYIYFKKWMRRATEESY